MEGKTLIRWDLENRSSAFVHPATNQLAPVRGGNKLQLNAYNWTATDLCRGNKLTVQRGVGEALLDFPRGVLYFPTFLSDNGMDPATFLQGPSAVAFNNRNDSFMGNRGNPLKRDKAFFTPGKRKFKYKYPGFQNEAFLSYQDLNTNPDLAQLLPVVNTASKQQNNHVIVTRYKTPTDMIVRTKTRPTRGPRTVVSVL
jgi:hypothetical protein